MADPTCVHQGCFQPRNGIAECCSPAHVNAVSANPALRKGSVLPVPGGGGGRGGGRGGGPPPPAKPVPCFYCKAPMTAASDKFCGGCGKEQPDPKATCAMKCTKGSCGGDIAESAGFCGKCGSARPDFKLTCAMKCAKPACGGDIAKDANFCGKCGGPRPILGRAAGGAPMCCGVLCAGAFCGLCGKAPGGGGALATPICCGKPCLGAFCGGCGKPLVVHQL